MVNIRLASALKDSKITLRLRRHICRYRNIGVQTNEMQFSGIIKSNSTDPLDVSMFDVAMNFLVSSTRASPYLK